MSLDAEKERTPEQANNEGKWAMTVFAIAIVLMLILFTAILFRPDGCQSSVPDDPCRDQAPLECLANTVEQASSSQFEHYVYCACVTDDGESKGYVAADKSITELVQKEAAFAGDSH